MASNKKQGLVVKAALPFVDARTGNSYNFGDLVEGWDDERAEHYAKIGLVTIENVPMEKPKPKETKETEEQRPGPKETKASEWADFTRIVGVGNATDAALHENGIHTFEALIEADVSFLPGNTQTVIEKWRTKR